MEGVWLFLYELLTVIVPAWLLTATAYFAARKTNVEWRKWQIPMIVFFSVYIFCMFNITSAGTLYDMKLYGLGVRTEEINLIPFSDPDLDRRAYGLNVLLFVPMGFLLPLIWEIADHFLYTCTAGFLLSFLIEASQMFNHRRTDVDDLILNTIGTVIGFAVFRLLFYGRSKIGKAGRIKFGPFIYITAMYLCRFLLFNEMGAAQLLYSF